MASVPGLLAPTVCILLLQVRVPMNSKDTQADSTFLHPQNEWLRHASGSSDGLACLDREQDIEHRLKRCINGSRDHTTN